MSRIVRAAASERFEHERQHLGRDRRASIVDRQRHRVAVFLSGDGDRRSAAPKPVRNDPFGTAEGELVHDMLAQLTPVEMDIIQRRFGLVGDNDETLEVQYKGKSIADVLGHRCIDTTFIYAKADLASLRQVALPWPAKD